MFAVDLENFSLSSSDVSRGRLSLLSRSVDVFLIAGVSCECSFLSTKESRSPLSRVVFYPRAEYRYRSCDGFTFYLKYIN